MIFFVNNQSKAHKMYFRIDIFSSYCQVDTDNETMLQQIPIMSDTYSETSS
jgi:hypothetical protein